MSNKLCIICVKRQTSTKKTCLLSMKLSISWHLGDWVLKITENPRAPIALSPLMHTIIRLTSTLLSIPWFTELLNAVEYYWKNRMLLSDFKLIRWRLDVLKSIYVKCTYKNTTTMSYTGIWYDLTLLVLQLFMQHIRVCFGFTCW